MSNNDNIGMCLALAKGIIMKWRRKEAVSDVEIRQLTELVVPFRDGNDAIRQRLFTLAMEIDAHHRDPFDRPLDEVTGLVTSLNEAAFLANQECIASTRRKPKTSVFGLNLALE
jgi:hypothetical protein